jgi:erythromycin esterase
MEESAARLGRYLEPLERVEAPHTDRVLGPSPPGLDTGELIALGEGTHGTREFITLRHRLVRHLVTVRGFRTLALEAGFVPTLGVDRAVRREGAPPAPAIADLQLWVWRTQGLASLLEWLASFNDGRPLADRVRVIGVNLGDPGRPAGHLARVLPEVGLEGEEITARLSAFAEAGHADAGRVEELQEGFALAQTARERLREDGTKDGSTVGRVAERLCRQLEQSSDWNQLRLSSAERFHPDAFERRDRHMAETAAWALETDPGKGAVLWAHNAHIKRGHFDMPQDWATGETMGEGLDRRLGASYRPLGTAFGRGRFRATPSDGGRPRAWEANPPRDDSVEAAIDAEDGGAGFLDLAEMRKAGLEDWTDRTRQLRSIQALLDEDADPDAHYMETDVPGSFDGLFYLPRSTPTRLIQGEES